MSVIVEDNEGNIILYCKGADSIIEARMYTPDEFFLKKKKIMI